MSRVREYFEVGCASGRLHATRPGPFLLSGLLVFSVLPAIFPACVWAENATSGEQSVADPYAPHIAEASHRFGLPERWIRAVLAAESDGIVRVVSSKGAMGLMQIMPETWVELSARYGLDGDLYDPRGNILAGTAYLRELYDRYGSPGFLAAYNAGPARYDEYLADGRPLPVETRNFVAALTPYIDASGASLAAIPPQIDRIDWTQAPLFIATSNHGVASDSVPSPPMPKTTPVALSVERDERLAPDASGLFVAPSQARERQ